MLVYWLLFQDIEVQMQSDSDNAQDEIRSLQDQHLTEKRRREDAEQEMEKQKQVINTEMTLSFTFFFLPFSWFKQLCHPASIISEI